MFEAVNAGWMDLGVEGAEHVAGTTSPRDVFEAAQKAASAEVRGSAMRCDFPTCSGNSHLLRNECVAAGCPKWRDHHPMCIAMLAERLKQPVSL